MSRAGGTVRLRRVLISGGARSTFEIKIPALVRGYAPDQLAGDIKHGDRLVILSPSALDAKQWHKGVPLEDASDGKDPRLALLKKAEVIITGKKHQVVNVIPFIVQDVLVRIELQVRG